MDDGGWECIWFLGPAPDSTILRETDLTAVVGCQATRGAVRPLNVGAHGSAVPRTKQHAAVPSAAPVPTTWEGQRHGVSGNGGLGRVRIVQRRTRGVGKQAALWDGYLCRVCVRACVYVRDGRCIGPPLVRGRGSCAGVPTVAQNDPDGGELRAREGNPAASKAPSKHQAGIKQAKQKPRAGILIGRPHAV